MSAGWSTVAVFVGGVALGGLGVDAWHARSRIEDAEQRLEQAEQRPAQHVAAERRLADASSQGAADRQRGRDLAATAADCPVPDPLAGLLVDLAERSRRPAASLSGDSVPGSGDAGPSRGDR